MSSGLKEVLSDGIIFGFEFLDSFVAVNDTGILFQFVVELLHDFVVHFLDLFFELKNFILDWKEIVFELVELKLVDIFDFFHLIGDFEILDKLGLFFFDGGLLFFEFFNKIDFFFVIQDDIAV